MTVLYDILNLDDLINLTQKQKELFISEIIMVGKIEYYEKFKPILENEIETFIPADEMLKLLPMIIDHELFQIILSKYDFKQGQHFFFNYANNNDDKKIKEMVYNYFVEHYSHVLVDNMSKYAGWKNIQLPDYCPNNLELLT